jgi:hypothetical protein
MRIRTTTDATTLIMLYPPSIVVAAGPGGMSGAIITQKIKVAHQPNTFATSVDSLNRSMAMRVGKFA